MISVSVSPRPPEMSLMDVSASRSVGMMAISDVYRKCQYAMGLNGFAAGLRKSPEAVKTEIALRINCPSQDTIRTFASTGDYGGLKFDILITPSYKSVTFSMRSHGHRSSR